MKKIVFGITGLTLGGAERVLVDIVNALSNTYDITILTLYGGGAFEKEVSKKVHIKNIYSQAREKMSKAQKIKVSLSLLCPVTRKKIYKKWIQGQYDVEVAFLEGPMTWLFSCVSKAHKIVWVHNDIGVVFGDGTKSKVKKQINEKAYRQYQDIVFVSQDNLEKFNQVYPDNTSKKHVIYNYINADTVLKKAQQGTAREMKTDLPSFVQVSRLTDQKAVSRLIDVHKKLIAENKLHRIYIVGDGPLRESLETKIKELHLEDTFILLGARNNPYPYIKKADYFLLASYYEGYPMVLLEAKVLQKPILITDTAAREVLINYDQSLIVTNDKAGIYEGIKEFLIMSKKRGRKNKFSNVEILDEIRELLGE